VADDLWVLGDSGLSEQSKEAALIALKELAPKRMTAALLGALKSKTESVRWWACKALARQKDKPSAEGLEAALTHDPAESVRIEAAIALVEVRPLAMAALMQALQDDATEVRTEAARTILKLGDSSQMPDAVVKEVADKAVPALMIRIADHRWTGGDSGRSEGSKEAALAALKELAPQRMTEALLEALRSKTESVRWWACKALARQKDKPSGEGLAAALKSDPGEEVRIAAAAALVEVRPPAVIPLTRALEDKATNVRTEAARTLLRLGDSSQMSEDVVRNVTENAVPALIMRIGDDHWVPGDSGRSEQSKEVALAALKEMAPNQMTPALLAALRSKTEGVRAWACAALSRQTDKASAEGLAAALRDPSSNVRSAASVALEKRK